MFNTGQPFAYFGDEQAVALLDTRSLRNGPRPFVIAYNFPSWHRTPVMEKWFGQGWTEFRTLHESRPLFAGHQMPRQPLWGYGNEADPQWAEREIATAYAYGLDGWMVDWYWHNGTQFYQEQLENGFLRASNRANFKFALMWANHHWKNVYPAASPDQAAVLLPQQHSHADCLRVIDYAIRHYFQSDSYWRLNGGPVFGIFDLTLFVHQLTLDGARRALDAMRDHVRKAGLGDLHVQASHVYGGLLPHFRELGIGSATQYHPYGLTYAAETARTRVPFADAAAATIRSWLKLQKEMPVAFYPDCPVGWDDSARFGDYAAVVTGRSADQFERLLRAALSYANEPPPVVFLSSWNEWTEDHVLLPDLAHGYSYLEAVRRVFPRPG